MVGEGGVLVTGAIGAEAGALTLALLLNGIDPAIWSWKPLNMGATVCRWVGEWIGKVIIKCCGTRVIRILSYSSGPWVC